MKHRLLSTCIAAALLTLSAQSHAGPSICSAAANNLLVNCGFETGTFAGWTLSGNDVTAGQEGNLYGVEGSDPDGTSPHSGAYQAYFGDVVTNATTLSQTLQTVVGQTYSISFWIAQDTTPDNSAEGQNALTYRFGGVSISNANLGVLPYSLFTLTTAATSASTVFSITLADGLGFMLLDDVQVIGPRGTAATVPEPSTLALSAIAALGLGLTMRRRRRR